MDEKMDEKMEKISGEKQFLKLKYLPNIECG
jgi:hypothetical protein